MSEPPLKLDHQQALSCSAGAQQFNSALSSGAAQVYKPATPQNGRAEVMFLRHYQRGLLQKETVLSVAEQDLRRQELKAKPKMRRAEKHAAVQVHASRAVHDPHDALHCLRRVELEARPMMRRAGKHAAVQVHDLLQTACCVHWDLSPGCSMWRSTMLCSCMV